MLPLSPLVLEGGKKNKTKKLKSSTKKSTKKKSTKKKSSNTKKKSTKKKSSNTKKKSSNTKKKKSTKKKSSNTKKKSSKKRKNVNKVIGKKAEELLDLEKELMMRRSIEKRVAKEQKARNDLFNYQFMKKKSLRSQSPLLIMPSDTKKMSSPKLDTSSSSSIKEQDILNYEEELSPLVASSDSLPPAYSSPTLPTYLESTTRVDEPIDNEK